MGTSLTDLGGDFTSRLEEEDDEGKFNTGELNLMNKQKMNNVKTKLSIEWKNDDKANKKNLQYRVAGHITAVSWLLFTIVRRLNAKLKRTKK